MGSPSKKSWSQVAKEAKGPTAPLKPTAPKRRSGATKQKDMTNVVFVQIPEKTTKPHPFAVLKSLQAKGLDVKDVWSTKLGLGLRLGFAAKDGTPEHASIVKAVTGGTPTQGYTAHTVVVKRVPKIEGITPEAIKEEATRVTGKEPVDAFPSKYEKDAWLVKFREAAPKGFKLFITSAPSRPVEKRRSTPQCSRCWRFHATDNCTYGKRCSACGFGKEPHECPIVPRCPNCNGPHRADSEKCRMRPKKQNGVRQAPGKEQREAIRKASTMARKNAVKAAAKATQAQKTGTAGPGRRTLTEEEKRAATCEVLQLSEQELEGTIQMLREFMEQDSDNAD